MRKKPRPFCSPLVASMIVSLGGITLGPDRLGPVYLAAAVVVLAVSVAALCVLLYLRDMFEYLEAGVLESPAPVAAREIPASLN